MREAYTYSCWTHLHRKWARYPVSEYIPYWSGCRTTTRLQILMPRPDSYTNTKNVHFIHLIKGNSRLNSKEGCIFNKDFNSCFQNGFDNDARLRDNWR